MNALHALIPVLAGREGAGGYPDLICHPIDHDLVAVRGEIAGAGIHAATYVIHDVFGDDLVPVPAHTSLMTRTWHNEDPEDLAEVADDGDPQEVVAYAWFQLVPESAFSGPGAGRRRFVPAPGVHR